MSDGQFRMTGGTSSLTGIWRVASRSQPSVAVSPSTTSTAGRQAWRGEAAGVLAACGRSATFPQPRSRLWFRDSGSSTPT